MLIQTKLSSRIPPYHVQFPLLNCYLAWVRLCWGKILTGEMALKQSHKTNNEMVTKDIKMG